MSDPSAETILISGASGALGSALVERYAARYKVVALERSRDKSLAVEPASPSLLRVSADTTNLDGLRAALSRAEAEQGALTQAVLTTGAWRGGHAFHEAEAAADYRTVMDSNLEATQLTLRALLPGMVARRRGSIVLIGSLSAVRPFEAAGAAAYAASKAALIALAQAVAAEVLEHGVRINVVMPATIDTPANRSAMPKADHSRWVSTESLGTVIEFLLSDGARDISGAAIPVYGRSTV